MSIVNKEIRSGSDLITTHAQTRQGFLNFALYKNQLSTPYIDQAKVLMQDIKTITKPEEVVDLVNSRSPIIAAAGISDKATNYLDENDLDDAIQQLIKKHLKPAGPLFREELVYRFLLNRGDALGGKMRNLVGHIAQGLLVQRLSSALTNRGIKHLFFSNKAKRWESSYGYTNFEDVKAVSWTFQNQPYILGFNMNIPKIGKNIDINLFKGTKEEFPKDLPKQPNKAIMFGELKGGIDPAGADEHWKTGNSALERDRKAFNYNIKTSFVGAAIAEDMANEIYQQLQDGTLSNAANLYKDNQLTEYVQWIIEGC